MLKRLIATDAPRAAILIRLMVGVVFVSEGIQKFLFPEAVGAGRFLKIGLPAPEMLASLVGGVEIACGLLILLGLLTRAAALPLIVIMTVAVTSTKIPILLEEGFWKMAHESRTDWSMLLGLLFLLLVGPGPWSLDPFLSRNTNRRNSGRTKTG